MQLLPLPPQPSDAHWPTQEWPTGALRTADQPAFDALVEEAFAELGRRWRPILDAFDACGVDSERYTGFAFGMGMERAAMLRHGVSHIRLLYEPDVRFLEQL